jgi:iron(III) transport system permease protein
VTQPSPELAATAPPAAPARRARRRRGGPLVPAALALAALFAAPLGYLVYAALTEAEASALLLSADMLGPLRRTLTLAVLTSAASAVVGTATAWLVVRADVPGRRLWRLLLPLPLVIPSFLGAAAWIAAFAPGGLVQEFLGVTDPPQVRGLVASVVVITLLSYPYVYLPVAARLNQLPPSLEEAARLLGRRPVAVFRQVVLPQTRGAILAGTLLVFLYAVAEFGAVQLLRYDTFTRAIFSAYKSFQTPRALALGLNLALLALLVVVLERAVARAPSAARARAVQGLRVRLGRWRAPATALVAATVGLGLVAPVGVLVFWAGRGVLRGASRSSALVSDLGALVAPAANTARLSLAAAAVATAAVLPIAYVSVRRRSRAGTAANAFVVAGFAIPGLAIALALVFLALRAGPVSGLYQTTSLLVVGYAVHFGAQALRAAEVAVASVPRRLDEAARALGAGRTRRFLTVELPLMGPGLLAGAGLVLLSTMKELPATLLLAPPGMETLATRIWSASSEGFLADAAVAGLVLVALSGVLTWLLVIRRSDAL